MKFWQAYKSNLLELFKNPIFWLFVAVWFYVWQGVSVDFLISALIMILLTPIFLILIDRTNYDKTGKGDKQ